MLAFLTVYVKIYSMKNLTNEKKRIHLLDEIRGFAVFCMVLYHGFFILGELFEVEAATKLFDFFTPVEPFFAGIFIFVCGISCSLSRSNTKRGIKILIAALALTLVTCLILPAFQVDGLQIYFGILHFLSCCILIYALLSEKIGKLNPLYGIIACAVLFPFFSGIESGVLSYGKLIVLHLPQVLYKTNYLCPLGFYNPEFACADYFPLFPDIFIFFAGVFSGIYLTAKGFPEYSYKQRIPFFGFLGRKAFIIYLAHMPVIAGIAYAVEFIVNHIR